MLLRHHEAGEGVEQKEGAPGFGYGGERIDDGRGVEEHLQHEGQGGGKVAHDVVGDGGEHDRAEQDDGLREPQQGQGEPAGVGTETGERE